MTCIIQSVQKQRTRIVESDVFVSHQLQCHRSLHFADLAEQTATSTRCEIVQTPVSKLDLPFGPNYPSDKFCAWISNGCNVVVPTRFCWLSRIHTHRQTATL